MTTTSNFGLPIYGNSDIPKWTDTNEAFQDLDSKAADKTGDNSFSGTNTFGGQVTHNADLLMKSGSTVESDDGVITPTAPSSDKTGTDVIQINDSAGNPLYKVRPIQHSNGKVDLDIAGQPAANGGTLTFNGEDVMNQVAMRNYSTTEKVVGTWIDGKPLYERMFLDAVSIGNSEAAHLERSLGLSNIDIAFLDMSFARNTNVLWCLPSAYGVPNNMAYLYLANVNVHNHDIVCCFDRQNTGWTGNGVTICYNIRYTKTTD